MNKVAPSILSADFSELGHEIKRVADAGADLIHIDVMDGHFVPNLTFGAPVIKCIRKVTDLPFDVHLMIEKPERYLEDFRNAGADIITVHAESCDDLKPVINKIKSLGAKAGVSVNPATPLNVIEDVLPDVDMVLLMSVNPGFGGQSYIASVTEKIRTLRKLCDEKNYDIDIEVDGGIDKNTVSAASEAGANIIVAGSAIYGADDMAEMISIIKNA